MDGSVTAILILLTAEIDKLSLSISANSDVSNPVPTPNTVSVSLDLNLIDHGHFQMFHLYQGRTKKSEI